MRVHLLLALTALLLGGCLAAGDGSPQTPAASPSSVPSVVSGGGRAGGSAVSQGTDIPLPPEPSPDGEPAPAPLPAVTPEPGPPEPLPPAPSPLGVPPPAISAAAAIVLDEASGTALHERDADTPLPPASLTKIATAIIALEEGNHDDSVTVDVNSRVMRGSSLMGLLPGDRFSLRDLLYGVMLPSGNDAALAVGRHLAGSDSAFVAKMNSLAARLGLKHTSFANPHGLSAQGHASSARDIAMLARYAMSVPGFQEIVTAHTWTANGSRTIAMKNINTFITSYPGADGVKTGYTRRAGRTIAASASQGGHRVYVVLLNAPQQDEDIRRLFDWAFSAFRWPQNG